MFKVVLDCKNQGILKINKVLMLFAEWCKIIQQTGIPTMRPEMDDRVQPNA